MPAGRRRPTSTDELAVPAQDRRRDVQPVGFPEFGLKFVTWG